MRLGSRIGINNNNGNNNGNNNTLDGRTKQRNAINESSIRSRAHAHARDAQSSLAEDDVMAMKVAQLREALVARDIEIKGLRKKKDLQTKLLEAIAAEAVDAELDAAGDADDAAANAAAAANVASPPPVKQSSAIASPAAAAAAASPAAAAAAASPAADEDANSLSRRQARAAKYGTAVHVTDAEKKADRESRFGKVPQQQQQQTKKQQQQQKTKPGKTKQESKKRKEPATKTWTLEEADKIRKRCKRWNTPLPEGLPSEEELEKRRLRQERFNK
jgi:hypothetical protein